MNMRRMDEFGEHPETEVISRDCWLSRIFHSMYPKVDFHLLIELSQDADTDNEAFFMSQIFNLVSYENDVAIDMDEKNAIEKAFSGFLAKDENAFSSVSREIHATISINRQSTNRRLEEISKSK